MASLPDVAAVRATRTIRTTRTTLHTGVLPLALGLAVQVGIISNAPLFSRCVVRCLQFSSCTGAASCGPTSMGLLGNSSPWPRDPCDLHKACRLAFGIASRHLVFAGHLVVKGGQNCLCEALAVTGHLVVTGRHGFCLTPSLGRHGPAWHSAPG